MENFSYSSYPESGDSSPRSREIDVDNAAAWDDAVPPPAAGRVKVMCSYGGKIQPRSHDNQLTYVGGDTKILALERTLRFPAVLAKLASLAGAAPDEVCFKYQLPGEDLDALISVTNDEDLEHMAIEYDRLLRSSPKPVARLRLFLFPLEPPPPLSTNASADSKSDRQWFVDALNSVSSLNSTVASADHLPLESPPPPPDYLFGLGKGFVAPQPVKVNDQAPPLLQQQPLPESLSKEERQQFPTEPQMPQEMQRFSIPVDGQEKAVAPAAMETLSRVYPTEYYAPVVQEHKPPAQPLPVSSQIPAPAPAPAPAPHWPEPPRNTGSAARFASVASGEHPLYLIPSAYPHAGQGYYGAVPRMVAAPTKAAEGYYSVAPASLQPSPAAEGYYMPPASSQPFPSAGGYNSVHPAASQPPPAAEGYYQVAPATSHPVAPATEGYYSVAPPSSQPAAAAEGYYFVAPASSQAAAAAQNTAKLAAYDGATRVAYDNAGRAFYYTTNAGPTAYQTGASVGLTAADAANMVKPPPVS